MSPNFEAAGIDPISGFLFKYVIDGVGHVILPLMIASFFIGIILKIAVYYIAKVENRFASEFEKRVRYFFESPDAPKIPSFYRLTRILLEKTYLDCFEKRDKYKRRSLDYIQSLFDRLFLAQDAIKQLARDTLRHVKYLKKDQGMGQDTQGAQSQRMLHIARNCFENNPQFNHLMGVPFLPLNLINEVLNVLPGLFLIGGILGTFLGIAKGLPQLGGMDLGNLQESKVVMDHFLVMISQAMVKSIIGIGFSAAMSLVNTFFSVEGHYYRAVNRFSGALEHLWNETTTNEVDKVEAA